MSCTLTNCDICNLSDRIRTAKESKDLDVMSKFIDELADMWLQEAEDNAINKCIIDGSWETADEIIAQRRRALKNRQQTGTPTNG